MWRSYAVTSSDRAVVAKEPNRVLFISGKIQSGDFLTGAIACRCVAAAMQKKMHLRSIHGQNGSTYHQTIVRRLSGVNGVAV